MYLDEYSVHRLSTLPTDIYRLIISMAPRRKCNETQLVFLQGYLERYLACASPAAFDAFWTLVNGAYFRQFPERASLVAEGTLPGEDEIQLPPEQVKQIMANAVQKRKKVHFFR
jgi:hypothetical protein